MDIYEQIRGEARRAEGLLGYRPNILHPRTFNEHIQWKKFFNRIPLQIRTVDKVEAKVFVQEQLKRNDLIIPTLWAGENPDMIPFLRLPKNYIVKPTHLSGESIAVRGGKGDKEAIVGKCKKWLNINYGKKKYEWAYTGIRPRVIIEPLISLSTPVDYKFHMFSGECGFVYVEHGRYTNEHARIPYDKNWNRMPFKFKRFKDKPEYPRPEKLDEMLEIAGQLSRMFYFVRVDLYWVDGKIYFGELTHYPDAGAGAFDPPDWDRVFGQMMHYESDCINV